MIMNKSLRLVKSAGNHYTTIHDYEMYLDKTYALKNAQEMQLKNEEAVDKVSENVKDASYLKKNGLHVWIW